MQMRTLSIEGLLKKNQMKKLYVHRPKLKVAPFWAEFWSIKAFMIIVYIHSSYIHNSFMIIKTMIVYSRLKAVFTIVVSASDGHSLALMPWSS